MWTLIFFLLPLINGLENDISCDSGFSNCIPSRSHTPEFPRNKEEIDGVCFVVLEHLTCLRDVTERCSENSSGANYFSKILEDINKICNEQSSLYKALNQNLLCYETVLKNYSTSCNKLATDTNYAVEAKNNDTIEKYQYFSCLRRLADMGCMMNKIYQTCGDYAESTAWEVFDAAKAMLGSTSCNENIIGEILAKMNAILIDENVKIRMRTLAIKWIS